MPLSMKAGLLAGALAIATSVDARTLPATKPAPTAFMSGQDGGARPALNGETARGTARITSPDGTIEFALVAGPSGEPSYTVVRRGEAVLAPSRLGFAFTNGKRTDAFRMGQITRSTVDRTLPVVIGRTSRARDHYNEMVVPLENATGGPVAMRLIVRAYDDGLAFRYVLKGGTAPIEIRGERTGFYFAADAHCWGLNVGRTTSSHEGEFDPVRMSSIRAYNMYDAPLLCRTSTGSTNMLFGEADLTDYAGTYFSGREDGGLGIETVQASLPDDKRVAVRQPAGHDLVTPWRVVLMADRAGDLIASNTIGNLNPQPTGDFSWVKPGKSAWDWWSGPFVQKADPGRMDMATLKTFIDFAGRSALQYMMVDEGWSLRSGIGGSAPSDTDITQTQPWLNMPELVAYAKARKVGLMLWLQWSQLDARLDEALDQYARWGIKGIKVDFMDRNDQQMVAYYHRVLAAAAKRHLTVNFHGAYPPTGLARTWPNFVTQEGVMGAEYNKWSRRVTPQHNVRLAYTRLVLGPMDYTPGGFRNRTPATFAIVNSPPQVQTSRAAALAMYVVYESPVAMVSDSPDAYAGVPEFDFISQVPTSWDETRFLDGDIDSHVVVARRRGRDWYIGALNGSEPRAVDLKLDWLGQGAWTAEIRQDGAQPTLTRTERRSVTADDHITLQLAGAGGAVVRLVPRR